MKVDEDIEIKLIIPKDKLLMKNLIPIPGENIIKEYLRVELENRIFKPLINDEVEEYGYYPETIEKQCQSLIVFLLLQSM